MTSSPYCGQLGEPVGRNGRAQVVVARGRGPAAAAVQQRPRRARHEREPHHGHDQAACPGVLFRRRSSPGGTEQDVRRYGPPRARRPGPQTSTTTTTAPSGGSRRWRPSSGGRRSSRSSERSSSPAAAGRGGADVVADGLRPEEERERPARLRARHTELPEREPVPERGRMEAVEGAAEIVRGRDTDVRGGGGFGASTAALVPRGTGPGRCSTTSRDGGARRPPAPGRPARRSCSRRGSTTSARPAPRHRRGPPVAARRAAPRPSPSSRRRIARRSSNRRSGRFGGRASRTRPSRVRATDCRETRRQRGVRRASGRATPAPFGSAGAGVATADGTAPRAPAPHPGGTDGSGRERVRGTG